MFTYSIFKSKVKNREVGQYTSYGIVVRREQEEYHMHDLTSNQELVLGLAELLNRNQVSVTHFKDVIEDFMGTGEIFRFYPDLCF